MKISIKLLFINLLLVLITGCYSTKYINLNKDPEYSKWVGKEFELKVDCYMTTAENYNNKLEERYYALWDKDFLGLRQCNDSNINKVIKGLRILASIPKGVKFKVESIFFADGFSDTRKYVYIRLLHSEENNLLYTPGLTPFMCRKGLLFPEEYAKELNPEEK